MKGSAEKLASVVGRLMAAVRSGQQSTGAAAVGKGSIKAGDKRVQKALVHAMSLCTFKRNWRQSIGTAVPVDDPPVCEEELPLHPWVVSRHNSKDAWVK